jgi:hypothetical protein
MSKPRPKSHSTGASPVPNQLQAASEKTFVCNMQEYNLAHYLCRLHCENDGINHPKLTKEWLTVQT